MLIPFTQFMRPDGRRVSNPWDTKDPISVNAGFTEEHEQKALALVEAGCRFEVEVLMNGRVHMDCQTSDGETVLANTVCDNDTQVPDHVKHLIERAHEAFNG